jgi:hypothetical protein
LLGNAEVAVFNPLCSSSSFLKLIHLLDFVKRLEISEAEIIHKHPSPEAEFLDEIGTKVLGKVVCNWFLM